MPKQVKAWKAYDKMFESEKEAQLYENEIRLEISRRLVQIKEDIKFLDNLIPKAPEDILNEKWREDVRNHFSDLDDGYDWLLRALER